MLETYENVWGQNGNHSEIRKLLGPFFAGPTADGQMD